MGLQDLTPELDALASVHRHNRAAGQTHAVVAGAVEWARTAPAGLVAVIVVGQENQKRAVLGMLAKLCPEALRSRVRVASLGWLSREAWGWSGGPVLLDGTAYAELAGLVNRRADGLRAAHAAELRESGRRTGA